MSGNTTGTNWQRLSGARERLKGPAWVTPEALNVSPELLDVPLARPVKRALAIGVDLLLIAMLSGASNIWLVAALVLMGLQFRKKQAAGSSKQRKWVVWLLCLAFVWLGVQHGRNFMEDDTPDEHDRPAATSKAKRFLAAKRTEAAALALKQELQQQETNKNDGRTKEERDKAAADAIHAVVSAAASPLTAPAASAPEADAPAETTDADRIEQLEKELEEARKPQVFRWREQAKRWLDGLGVGFGWAIVYFSLLPAWLQGQTLGKKLFGLRVVELTGKPLTVMSSFSRYGGYAAGMATGMMGFAQVLWDVNRQAIQDKIAHTVVVDLRAPRRSSAEAAAPAPATPDDGATQAQIEEKPQDLA